MRNELRKIITPSIPGATIGESGLREHPKRTFLPVHRTIDFYDTAGRLYGAIVIVPLLYGLYQSQHGHPLSLLFWGLVAATAALAIFGRRPPSVRLTPGGISFPETRSAEYPWDQMCEARAHSSELDILLSTGEHVQISYRKLRTPDVARLKRLVRLQFEAIAERERDKEGTKG